MNDDKLINLMNDIDESYIDEAMPKRFRRRFPLARLVSIAACIALLIGIGASVFIYNSAFSLPSPSGRLETKHISGSEYDSVIIKPDSIAGTLDFMGIVYGSGYYVRKSETAAENVGIAIEKGVSLGMQSADIYEISGISRDFAIAVSDAESVKYSVYVNMSYFAATREALENALSLEENAVFTSAYYYYKDKDGEAKTAEFVGVGREYVYDAIFGGKDKELIASHDADSDICMKLCMEIPSIGCKNAVISLTADGTAYITVFDMSYRFDLGRIRTHRLINHIAKNCKGYDIIIVSEER